MIRYQLICDNDHGFEAWYPSAHAFDALQTAGHVTCAVCGSPKMRKDLMAPTVRPARAGASKPRLGEPKTEVEVALTEMRRQIEANSEYVGLNFTAEARRMHEGDAPERSIYGEARLEDAKAMLQDGIRVAPLPFMPRRQVN